MDNRIQTYRRALTGNPMLYSVAEQLYGRMENEDGAAVMCYVMAPVMCLYVAWVLRQACASGKKRLYFLARDGYPMYEISQILCKELDLPIECRYLHCSRYAWRGAEYHLLKEDSLHFICLGGIDVTFQRLMGRAGLTDAEGREIARLLHREESYEMPLAYRQVKSMQKQLAECRPFMELMAERSAGKYPAVCGYLEQEGLTEDLPWAVVDSGWTGSLQKSLRHLLETMGCERKVEGYYFGMYEYPKGADRETYHSWYFNPGNGIRRKVYFSNSLFECIFCSPEGMATGYELGEDGYRPQLEKQWNPNRARIEKSTGCLRQYAWKLARAYGRNFLLGDRDGRETAYLLLKPFMGKPTAEEAQWYGSYVFCDDVIGEGARKAAAELTPGQIKGNRLLRKAAGLISQNGEAVPESAWMEGSITNCGLAPKELWHCVMYKYILYIRKLWHNFFTAGKDSNEER